MKRLLILSVSLVVFASGIVAWLFLSDKTHPRDFSGLQGDVKRGAYLARLSGCFACHTDYSNQGKLFAGGEAIATPFGRFYAPNITMHPDEGIGGWTLQDFSLALSEGISPAGEHYFPVFPYENYRYFSNQDILDLWKAFNTVPAAEGESPGPDVDFPFNQRVLIGPWKKLFLQELMPEFSGPEGESLARGSYIVNGPGHCVGCHTPRNSFGGLQLQYYLQGGQGPADEITPAITRAALEERGYIKEDVAFVLRDGITPDGDALGGSMGEVITHNTRWLTDQDLMAIAEFLWGASGKQQKQRPSIISD